MTSKKTASSKRAAPARACDYTKTFLKDWERLSRSGRYDLKRLKEAMLLLIANDAPLGSEWLDHPLKGDWADHRECHIGGDYLLIYRLDGNAAIFERAGTHSDLFEELALVIAADAILKRAAGIQCPMQCAVIHCLAQNLGEAFGAAKIGNLG